MTVERDVAAAWDQIHAMVNAGPWLEIRSEILKELYPPRLEDRPSSPQARKKVREKFGLSAATLNRVELEALRAVLWRMARGPVQ